MKIGVKNAAPQVPRSIALVGCGAISEAVAGYLAAHSGVAVVAAIVNPGSEQRAREVFGAGVEVVSSVDDMSLPIGLAVDCAGHSALRQHGEAFLSAGVTLVSVSTGALADAELYDRLVAAARRGAAQLRFVSGAIGALDALSAADIGSLQQVTYRGRKPPRGWRGSPAEAKLDLEALSEPAVHFKGTARDAALQYPKNANVAASVALAGIGFDDTRVELVADPGATRNVHEISAAGDFGRFEFRIEGDSLPNNPRSSAITAMSVVREILNPSSPILI